MKRQSALLLVQALNYFAEHPDAHYFQGVSRQNALSLVAHDPTRLSVKDIKKQAQFLELKANQTPQDKPVFIITPQNQPASELINKWQEAYETDIPPPKDFNEQLGTNLKQNSGPLVDGLKNIALEIGKKPVMAAAKKLGFAALKATVPKLAAALGGIGGPVGIAVSWAITKIIPFIKRNWKKLTIATASTIALLTGVPAAMAAGVGGFLIVFPGVLTAGVTALISALTIGIIAIPVLIAIILFIINSGAYIVPPAPVSETPYLEIIPEEIACSDEKGAIPFTNTTSSAIASRAWEIVADLYQGFWCYWNRSPGDFSEDVTLYPPSYPQLFDAQFFASNPNPSPSEMSSCANCLFWCTYLIQNSYRESGNTSLQLTLWSPTMKADFERRGKFISARQANPQNVVPGSVIFFQTASGPNRINHVAIVYSVNQDSIIYVQSNSATKSSSLTFNQSGQGIQSPSHIEVAGIGLP